MTSSDKEKGTSKTAASDGERRAMIGYLPQYELGAMVVLNHLRAQTFEFLRLGDPTAGQVDDFVIGSSGAIDGYSVKWSQYRGTITFNDLIKTRRDSSPWIKQLADGWQTFRASYITRKASVHLVSSDSASSSDSCKGTKAKQTSFAAFIYQAWLPKQRGEALPAEWSQTWEILQDASGLNAQNFDEFCKFCHFDLTQTLASEHSGGTRDQIAHRDQVKQLARSLAEIVRDPSRQVEFDRAKLLTRLDWNHLFEFQHRHEFPVRDPYEPIAASVVELRSKLAQLDGGYIGLFGSPGSGKSTLLTKTLEEGADKYRLIKYYAFVPGMSDPRSTRGESVNFLHDLVLSIERAGFSQGESQATYDRLLLLSRLHTGLALLGEDFSKTQIPTVILIDGLDHIAREQSPERSLLEDLPTPDQLPKGVYIILGSQTDRLPKVAPSVRQFLLDVSRRIEIEPLTKSAVIVLLQKVKLVAPLDDVQTEKVLSVANGHPLVLSILLASLSKCGSGSAISELLSQAVPFAGDIDSYYFAHWEQIADDRPVVELLALFSRMRRGIDLHWVIEWADRGTLATIQQKLSHLFREERPGYWQFFHNSFRLYLRARSTEAFGISATAAERFFHDRLAMIAKESRIPHSWERVFHMASAGLIDEVIQIATPEYFRIQISELRPIDCVRRDARYSVQAAGSKKDVSGVVRGALFLAELSQRENTIDPWKVGSLLFSIGEVARAMEYVWDGTELRLPSKDALEFAIDLYQRGDTFEARALFKAAEPIILFQRPPDDKYGRDLELRGDLEAWARAAPLFRPIEEVLTIISRFEPSKSSLRPEEDDPVQWRRLLLFYAGTSARQAGEEEGAAAIEKALRELEGESPDYLHWFKLRAWQELDQAGRNDAAQRSMADFLGSVQFSALDSEFRYALTQDVVRVLRDDARAETFLTELEPPEIELGFSSGNKLSDHLPFLRFYRLLAYFNRCPNILEIAPDPSDSQKWPRTLLMRTLVQIARIWADAWRGQSTNGFEIRQLIHQPLRIYDHDHRDTNSWRNWHMVQGLRKDLHECLAHAVSLHGANAIETLQNEISSLIEADDGWTWTVDARRDIAVTLFRNGASKEWADKQLYSLTEAMFEGQDAAGRVEQCEQQAKAWLALGERANALTQLERLVNVSFSVGYRKDYQMDSWVEWFRAFSERSPQEAATKLPLYASAVVNLQENVESRAMCRAALSLLSAALKLSPRKAMRLLGFFEEHGCISYVDAVEEILLAGLRLKGCHASLIDVTFREYLLVFSSIGHGELCGELLKACVTGKNVHEDEAYCAKLVEAIKVKMCPDVRAGSLEKIRLVTAELGLGIDACDLTTIPEKKKVNDSQSSVIELSDGTQIEEGEFEEKTSTFDGLLSLLKRRGKESYRWRSAIERHLPKLDLASARKLAALIRSDFDEPVTLSKFSLRLKELGDGQAAKDFAKEAFDRSHSYGWVTWGDGGSRIWALRAIVAADPNSRDFVLTTFVDDISSEKSYPREVIQNLLEIVSLFPGTENLEKLYPLIENYVLTISEPNAHRSEAESALEGQSSDDSFETALCDLLSAQIGGYVSLLTQAAKKTLTQMIAFESKAAVKCVRQMLGEAGRVQADAVALLEGLSEHSPGLLSIFAEDLEPLRLSPNLWVAMTASKLSVLCGRAAVDRPCRPLPVTYSLTLPPTDESATGSVEVDAPLPEANSDRELLRSYDDNLSILADFAEIDNESVWARAAAIVRSTAPAADLSPDTERDLRQRLQDLDLRLPYRRIRGTYAREAMRVVAGELYDAKSIAAENLFEVMRVIRSDDPSIAMRSPSPRPKQIEPATTPEYSAEKRAEWLKALHGHALRHVRTIDSLHVLGEYTELRARGGHSSKEVRVSTVHGPAKSPPRISDSFSKLLGTFIADELETWLVRPSPSIIVQNSVLGADGIGTEWLSLDPRIAATLGWVLEQNEYLKWVDSDGKLMIQTIWWRDGLLEQYSTRSECQVAEGWLVVASSEAVRQIRGLIPGLVQSFLTQRSHSEGSEERQGPVAAEQRSF